MKDWLKKLFSSPFAIGRLEKKLDDLMILNAKNLLALQRNEFQIEDIHQVEFKVYSQWGDDGIIQYLINKLDIKEKSFIEFGVENYKEANTRFLLINNNWRGLVFDASPKNIRQIQSDQLYWQHRLTAECAFITRDNINDLIRKNRFDGEIGLLHIDIDGNDYWIWEALSAAKPDIVILEYNGYFDRSKAISIPYQESFSARQAHYSGLYFGASLAAFLHLADQKGYFFIGCNSAGNNAYFVKRKFESILKKKDLQNGFVEPTFRQARDEKGKLSYLNKSEALSLLKGLPVINVMTGETEYL